ncbi:MAG: hypothetical protein AB1468_04895 [Candidatus Micrarchaeota archaeon]
MDKKRAALGLVVGLVCLASYYYYVMPYSGFCDRLAREHAYMPSDCSYLLLGGFSLLTGVLISLVNLAYGLTREERLRAYEFVRRSPEQNALGFLGAFNFFAGLILILSGYSFGFFIFIIGLVPTLYSYTEEQDRLYRNTAVTFIRELKRDLIADVVKAKESTPSRPKKAQLPKEEKKPEQKPAELPPAPAPEEREIPAGEPAEKPVSQEMNDLEQKIFEKFGSSGVKVFRLIDGKSSAEDILALTGLRQEQLLELLENMEEEGFISLD